MLLHSRDALVLSCGSDVHLHGINVPTHGMGVPTHRRNVPTHGTGVLTHRRNVPTYDTLVPTHSRNVPTHRRNVPTHRRNVPTYDTEVTTHSRNVPTHGRNVPTHGTGVPTNHFAKQKTLKILKKQTFDFNPITVCIQFSITDLPQCTCIIESQIAFKNLNNIKIQSVLTIYLQQFVIIRPPVHKYFLVYGFRAGEICGNLFLYSGRM